MIASSLVAIASPLVAALDYAVKTPPLSTEWTYTVGEDPWTQYPRPQMVRERWKSLNGIWSYRQANGAEDIRCPPRGELDLGVLVPSCLESGLSGELRCARRVRVHGLSSGIMASLDGSAMFSWFQTTFDVPTEWMNEHVLINFGAVDYEATVFVNVSCSSAVMQTRLMSRVTTRLFTEGDTPGSGWTSRRISPRMDQMSLLYSSMTRQTRTGGSYPVSPNWRCRCNNRALTPR